MTIVTLLDTRTACFRDLGQIVAHKAEFKPNHAVVSVAMLLDFSFIQAPAAVLLRRVKWTHND